MNTRLPVILDHLASLADTTRSRILLLLDGHELTVTELCGIVQLPQSTVSRHLKALADSEWVTARAEGTSRLYTMTRDELDASARRLWLLVREQVGPTAAAGQDQRRLRAALAQRRTKSQEFFSSSAGHWDRVRDELFGDGFHLAALAALVRTLKPGGRAIIVDMLPHDRESYRQQMGHVWLGFSDDHIRRMLSEAGFVDARVVALAPDAQAKGPGLFVATGKKQNAN